jgi:hypothetical protein
VVGEITSLAHKAGDHTVKTGSLESKTGFTSAELTKVFRSLGDNISTEFHDDAARRLATNRDIEKDLRVGPEYGRANRA